MEALLEKEGDVENWNDDRLDELSGRMDRGFEKAATKAEMNHRFDAVDREMNRRFDEMGQRFDEMGQRFGESAAGSERFESKVGTEFHRFTDRLDKLFYLQLFFMTSLAIGLITDAV